MKYDLFDRLEQPVLKRQNAMSYHEYCLTRWDLHGYYNSNKLCIKKIISNIFTYYLHRDDTQIDSFTNHEILNTHINDKKIIIRDIKTFFLRNELNDKLVGVPTDINNIITYYIL